MPDSIVKNVQDMLNEEKWTRAAISNYSINNFKELDAIIKAAREQKILDELKEVCEEQLSHTRNSIIALYISGMITLSRQLIDDTAMVNLITIFVDNHKWNIVQHLCERILDWGESKYALKMLAECYQNENEMEKVYPIWERLIKVDFEETEIVKALAEYNEKNGDLDAAVDLYKKAIHRYLNKKLFSNVRDIWSRLVALAPKDIDFYLHVQSKTARLVSEDKAAILLQELFQSCHDSGDIETSIMLLKLILQYDEKDSLARKELVDCYREKHADHSQLEEYIRISNLAQSWRNVHEAIADFEKHISFDAGNFVFHRTWGVGRIASVKGDEIVIDFAKKRGHSMSLKMAVGALQSLGKEHIWVLKATKKKDVLHAKVKEDPEWTLKNVIKSFDNACDIKRIKAELVPGILSPGEWTSWSTKARNILKTNPSFGVSQDNIDVFVVRDRPITLPEKLFNEFKAARNFFTRVSTLRSFVEMAEGDIDSEYFLEMFSYFTAWIKSYNQANEVIVASYLLVKDLVTRFKHLNTGLQFNFSELFEQISDPVAVYADLKDSQLRQQFLSNIKLFVSEWPDIFVKLFPTALNGTIISNLEHEGFEDRIVQLVQHSYENYRDYKEAAIWFFKEKNSTDWLEKAGISYEKQLLTLVHILQTCYREIENHQNTTENRKTSRQLETLLFKDGIVEAYIKEVDEDGITRLYTLIEDVRDLDAGIKMKIRNTILSRFPKFKFYGTEEKSIVTRGLMVTHSKLIEKEKQLQHIQEVEVPENSKEIASALAQGDLRENAEYKAAKEKQDILNVTVAKLKDEIDRAQIFDPSTFSAARVGFGAKVTLENKTKNVEETYTILGPWESDPDRGIISYLSPFGASIMNRKPNEAFNFKIGDIDLNFVVSAIEAAKIE